MSAVQWILLVVAVVIVVGVYVYSRRDRWLMHRHAEEAGPGSSLLPPREKQLDIFSAEGFDEFGVGRPRRVAPRAGPVAPPSSARRTAPTLLGADAPRVAPTADVSRKAPAATADADEAVAPAEAAATEHDQGEADPSTIESAGGERKIVSLLVAERSGGAIDGVRLHAALRQQKLEYGARQIYHRMYEGAPVFSVASLVKPGHLDPGQAAKFSTPGLMLFMVLPGPQEPAAAVRDMLATAGRLAESLDGYVYDAGRKPLTPEAGRALQLEVESWSARNHAG
ncbi:MAG TPA: cell division protein ZipA C-terminal FtsZ-binding domain-containing protein [Nevskiaceae bacterium]